MRMRSAPWADWTTLDHFGAHWANTSGDYAWEGYGQWSNMSAAGAASCFVNDDQIESRLVSAGRTETVSGGIPKPTFQYTANPQGFAFMRRLPIPDFVFDKQPRRLSSRDGVDAYGNGQNGVNNVINADGGRRVALEVENVLTSISFANGDFVIGRDLVGFSLGVKFRGFGALAAGRTTQDAAVAANALGYPAAVISTLGLNLTQFGDPATTAFPDMSLPSDAGGDDLNVAPTFAPNGVCRIRHLVEIPRSVHPGDDFEITAALYRAGDAQAVAIQWVAAKYRWVVPPFAYSPNRGIQLTGQIEDAEQQLEDQSRLDTRPTEP